MCVHDIYVCECEFAPVSVMRWLCSYTAKQSLDQFLDVCVGWSSVVGAFTEASMVLIARKGRHCIFGKALAPASKKLLTSRQPDSTNVEDKVKNASFSLPISGKIC